MDIVRLVAKYQDKGFSRERAEVNALMEIAVFAIFRDFPDAFLLIGGATLVLFHESLRHSADLDLLALGASLPSREEIIVSIKRDVDPVARILQLGELRFETQGIDVRQGTIFVIGESRQHLFRIDPTRFGSAVQSEVEAHPMEGKFGDLAVIKSATKELLLLQKAEAFALRRHVKARDAYDIYLLQRLGAVLNTNLRAHLEDALRSNEISPEVILNRRNSVDADRCNLELKPMLPPKIYGPIEEAGFEPLREAVTKLYAGWL